ncbi:MAG: hypothetical protein WD138_03665, partial [Halofilum sp. (in: g-proteobacteria)]
GCSRGETAEEAGEGTFAQHPGFDEWFAANPPAPYAASRAERELLQRYRPHLRVPGSASGPLDFYRDYIAHGTLVIDDQSWTEVDRERLAAVADNPDAEFRHEAPPVKDLQPTAYGRVRYSQIEPFGEFTLLQWHFVFRYSGLPFDLPIWQEALAQMVGVPRDWHQLDHYTAATLVLGPDETPVGAILQQHNHQRAYWFDLDLALPEDGRLRLAAAVRSNELYPWRGEGASYRTVRFLNANTVDWLVTGDASPPRTAAYDTTVPGEPVDYRLQYLPGTDPFYRFQGRLGERRVTPGRDGPPGAAYNTLPEFKDPALQFCAFRWPESGEDERLAALRTLLADPEDEDARARLLSDCRDFIAETIGYNAASRSPGHADE